MAATVLLRLLARSCEKALGKIEPKRGRLAARPDLRTVRRAA